MPFAPDPADTRFSSDWIGVTTAAAIHHGTLPLIVEGPLRSRGPKGVADSATVKILVSSDEADAHLARLGFVDGAKCTSSDGFHSMWVENMSEEVETHLTSLITIRLVGLLDSGNKLLRRVEPVRNSVTLPVPVTDPPTVPPPQAAVIDYVTFDVIETYFQETAPDYTAIGTAITPADAPPGPGWTNPRPLAPGWSTGWHLALRVGEHIYGTLYKITDTYSYGPHA